MKKIFIIFLSLFIFSLIIFLPLYINNQKEILPTNVNNFVTHTDLINFYNTLPKNRTAKTNEEKLSANYLAQIMQDNNLEFFNSTSYIHKLKNIDSQNVIGVIKSNTTTNKNILISAHYDNAYKINGNLTNSNGALDNGSGILAVVSLIKYYKSNPSESFNLIFAFWGAEELEMQGSSEFVNSLSKEDKNNILCAFNFDTIGIGEFNYFFSTKQLEAKVKQNNQAIVPIPFNKKINILTSLKNLAFCHIGFCTDSLPFLQNNINTITFFSGNLNSISASYKESSKHKNIEHTENDNIDFILQNNPNFLTNINAYLTLTTNLINDENFGTQITNHYNTHFELNNKWIYIFIITLCALIYFIKSNKKVDF